MSQLERSFNGLMDRYGFDTELVRLVSATSEIRVSCKMRRRYAEEEKLLHDISQTTAWFIIRRTELEQAQFPLPVKKGDRVLEDGVYYTVFVTEPVMDGPNVIGYKVRTIGD